MVSSRDPPGNGTGETLTVAGCVQTACSDLMDWNVYYSCTKLECMQREPTTVYTL